MSSRRLPGKVLQPLAGRAILEHVRDAVAEALGAEQTWVATSTDPSDDAVEKFCRDRGYNVHRGPLDDVIARLQGALKATQAHAFFRVCADSPFYDPAAMKQAMHEYAQGEFDLVTNTFPRSFPKGRSVELARTETFLGLNSGALSGDEREHVFPLYYKNPQRFRVKNFSSERDFSRINLCVDTREDWERAERFLRAHPQAAHQFSNEELSRSFAEGAT